MSETDTFIESADTIHGRLLESVHITGYSMERACIGLEWLLEDDRWKTIGAGYERIDDFLKTINLSQFKIAVDQRKKLAKRLEDIQASQRATAAAFGVGVATINRDINPVPSGTKQKKTSIQDKELKIDSVPDGTLSRPNPLNVHFSSKTDEWTTPADIVARVLMCLGKIDVDPCSDEADTVPATIHYHETEDGLTRPWEGRVYMNPPYGDVIAAWVEKLVAEYECGHAAEAIALIPSRTDTQWFRQFAPFPRCFISGRLKFGGHENSAPFPSMAVYLGKNTARFKEDFGDIGDLYVRF